MTARRAGIARWVQAGKRVGYTCFAASVVLFIAGFVFRFTPALTTTIVVLMIVGCFVLPPAIVFGYGLRAAEREEREAAASRAAASRAAASRAEASGRDRPGPDRPSTRSSGEEVDE
ncbi:MAG: hypothetical protein QOJ19_4369 [Acidimicrobiia bacterium]|nr:hypothetical protein [Acidimicrobiia bacterium]